MSTIAVGCTPVASLLASADDVFGVGTEFGGGGDLSFSDFISGSVFISGDLTTAVGKIIAGGGSACAGCASVGCSTTAATAK